MRGPVFAVLALMSCDQLSAALVPGRAAPAAPKPMVVWRAQSPSGAAAMEQTTTAAGCHTRCAVSGQERWAKESCLADRDDFVFVSDDCATAIIVAASPQATQSWAHLPVLFRYQRGNLTRSYPGGPMLSDDAVDRDKGRYRWLKGPPKYLHNGVGISFEVLSGRVTRLPFQEGDRINVDNYVNDRPSQPESPPPRQPAVAQAPAEPERVITGTSDAGHWEHSTTTVLTRVCDLSGCRYIEQGPSTLTDTGDGLVCRTEGQDCGNGTDCCGGNCSEGKRA
jgi:hypothetical protein